jgi:hypothetical protein
MTEFTFSQEIKKRQVVQIAGMVIDNDDLNPIPFVNIGVKNSYRGTSADMNGFFSLVTLAGDYLTFSAVGFQSVTIHIPDTLVTDNYTIYQSLQKDTIELPLTVIYPWPSKEKFREAFLKLQVPDDDYERMRKNTTLAEMKERAKYQGMTASMNYRNFIAQQTDPLYWGGKLSGQQQPNNLLNPFAWARFLSIWKTQQEKKQKKSQQWYDYETGE